MADGRRSRALLDELAGDAAPLHTAVARLRGTLSPAQTHLLLEQVELRRRATAKFTHAARMFFTRIGLEQATDEWVARYKAARFHRPRLARSSPTSAAASAATLLATRANTAAIRASASISIP